MADWQGLRRPTRPQGTIGELRMPDDEMRECRMAVRQLGRASATLA
jgi:hypothetical protein